MDSNATRYHLLLGRQDWLHCTCSWSDNTLQMWDLDRQQASPLAAWPHHAEPNVAWDDHRAEVTLRPREFRFTAPQGDVQPNLEQRRGAARDRFGNWYWIDSSRQEIMVRSSGSEVTAHFWSAGDGVRCAPRDTLNEPSDFEPTVSPQPMASVLLSGLAITEQHYLVVGTLAPSGVLIFDLHAGGPPAPAPWPRDIAFAPFDMAAMPGGGVWILDRAHRRLWALDRRFGVIALDQTLFTLANARDDDFQTTTLAPTGADEVRRLGVRTFPTGIHLGDASPLDDMDPIAVEALPDGTVLILDNDPSTGLARVHRYRFGTQLGPPITIASLCDVLEQSPNSSAGDCQLLAHDFAYVAEHADASGDVVPDRLYFVLADGNQAFAFNVSWLDEADGALALIVPAERPYFPIRRFGGKGLVAAGDYQVYYDFSDHWVTLVEQRRPRYVLEAVLRSPVFDGREPDCMWHRLMVDACIPPGSDVRVRSRAADTQDALLSTSWQNEPHLILRSDGSELPFIPTPHDEAQSAHQVSRGTWHLLFQQARGRYLQVELTLIGDRRSTPRLQALRAYYPRFSYLTHYLPGVYREDIDSASFMDRLLALFEGFYTALEDRIAAVQVLFDPHGAPVETLDWLASWFDTALDPAWDEARRRLFISHAMEFFQYRGTVRGLQIALRLALDTCADERVFAEGPTVVPQRLRQSYGVCDMASVQRAVDPARPSKILHRSGIRIVEKFRTWRTGDGLAQLRARAHRFSVLLPVSSSELLNTEAFAARTRLAERVVKLEKPAHTIFDIRFYWDMFRVGEVRLGEDTLLGLGGRAPHLLRPAVLNQAYLAESVLAPSHPHDIAPDERRVLGRDELRDERHIESRDG